MKIAKASTPTPRPDDVHEELWRDWLTQRAKIGAVTTETVIKGWRKEAAKAGISLADAIEWICVQKPLWQGFKAEWYWKCEGLAPERIKPTFSERDRDVKRKAWEKMTGREWPSKGGDDILVLQ